MDSLDTHISPNVVKINHNKCYSAVTTNFDDLNYNATHMTPTYLSNRHLHKVDLNNNFRILHQNLRGLYRKTDEFLISVAHNYPHIVCLTEHHLRNEEISLINFGQYRLATYYCRKLHKHGGVSIYTLKGIQYNILELEKYNREKDIEICAIQVCLQPHNFIIICVYRSPTGSYICFMNQLELILNNLYRTSSNLVLCGDFNINHMDDNNRKQLLESLLSSFGLYSTVNFPTRIFMNSATLIDNIYINTNKFTYTIQPLINGISDHNAQIIVLPNISGNVQNFCYTQIRSFDNESLRSFTELLSYENWEEVFQDSNVNIIFNRFLDIYLKIFNRNFPIKKRYRYQN